MLSFLTSDSVHETTSNKNFDSSFSEYRAVLKVTSEYKIRPIGISKKKKTRESVISQLKYIKK